MPSVGGGLVGGNLLGGSLVGGGLGTDMPHPKLYHRTLALTPHEWELCRETASQTAGFKKSAMWPQMPSIKMQAPKIHYERIMSAHTPVIASKMLEAEHAQNSGAGFYNALKHVYRSAVNFFPRLKTHLTKFISPGLLKKQMPNFAQLSTNPTHNGSVVNQAKDIIQSNMTRNGV